MSEEYWRDIPGFEGLYQVSNMGRVKSLKDANGNYREKIKKLQKDKDGYLRINLCKNNKIKRCSVHRLVAEAFIPNLENLPVINHKDENPLNNNVNNLEWCTQNYNINYGTRNKKVSKSMTNNIKISKPVIGINKINGYICEFNSITEAERFTGITKQSICACCKGKAKSAGGYRWMYKNEVDKEVEK